MNHLTTDQLIDIALNASASFTQILDEPTQGSETEYASFVADRISEQNISWNKNRFFLAFNLKANEIQHNGGLQEVMGWEDNMTLRSFFQKIHPDYLFAWLHWSLGIYQLAEEMKHKLQPSQQSFQYNLPMLHGNGRYFWCSSKVVALRFDTQKNMVVHGNMYERREELTPFNFQLFEPFLIEKLEIMDGWNALLSQKMKPIVLSLFHLKEINVIMHSLAGLNADQIAEVMQIPKNTILAYKKNILRCGQLIGGKPFHDAAEVGRYFRRMGWV